MSLPPAPQTVRVGSLVLGRGSVYEYATRHYIDRERQTDGACGTGMAGCLPCLDGRLPSEPMVETHAGSKIRLKTYTEDIEQTIYENRTLDGLSSLRAWRWTSSPLLIWMMLIALFVLACMKNTVPLEDSRHMTALTGLETICGFYCLIVRTIETLCLYWRERKLRHNLEVTAWDDGTVSRGRPLSLFICIWMYLSIETALLLCVLFGNLVLAVNEMSHWTLLTTTMTVLVISEPLTCLTQRHLVVWNARIMEDHLRLTLIESMDLFEEVSCKLKDFETQNKIYAFREAVSKSFQLERYKHSYMIK